MTLEQWLYIYLGFTVLFAGYKVIPLAIRRKSLTYGLFALSLAPLLVAIIFLFDGYRIPVIAEWGRLIAIVLAICGLFSFIRASKPVFARFPGYMVFLPLISLIFYPLTIDALVIKRLILITYEGGALVVSLIFFITRTLRNEQPDYYTISGVILFLLAYITFWFIPEDEVNTFVLSIALFGAGIILLSIGFSKETMKFNQPQN